MLVQLLAWSKNNVIIPLLVNLHPSTELIEPLDNAYRWFPLTHCYEAWFLSHFLKQGSIVVDRILEAARCSFLLNCFTQGVDKQRVR